MVVVVEPVRCLDDRRLDLTDVEHFGLVQRDSTGGDARRVADHQHLVGGGPERHGDVTTQHLGRHVEDRGVGLAVDPHGDPALLDAALGPMNRHRAVDPLAVEQHLTARHTLHRNRWQAEIGLTLRAVVDTLGQAFGVPSRRQHQDRKRGRGAAEPRHPTDRCGARVDEQQHRSSREVERDRDRDRVAQPQQRDQQKTRAESAGCRTDGVDEVDVADCRGGAPFTRHHPHQQWEQRTEHQGRSEHREERQNQPQPSQPRAVDFTRDEDVQEQVGEVAEADGDPERQHPQRQQPVRERAQGVGQPVEPDPADQAAECDARQEAREHGGEGVGRRPEDHRQRARPSDLVGECGEPDQPVRDQRQRPPTTGSLRRCRLRRFGGLGLPLDVEALRQHERRQRPHRDVEARPPWCWCRAPRATRSQRTSPPGRRSPPPGC